MLGASWTMIKQQLREQPGPLTPSNLDPIARTGPLNVWIEIAPHGFMSAASTRANNGLPAERFYFKLPESSRAIRASMRLSLVSMDAVQRKTVIAIKRRATNIRC